MIAQIRHRIHTERRKKKETRAKHGLTGTINSTQEMRHTRKLEEESGRLQKAAGQNNMQPIWGYRRRLRTNTNAGNISIKKMDGTERQGMTETMKRLGEWAAEFFRKKEDQLTPKIEHIQELGWGGEEMQIGEGIQLIRQQEALAKIIQEEPETETWRNQEYDEQDIGREIRNLSGRKAHGSDGIPGDAYKATRKWATKPITRITNATKQGKYPKTGRTEP